MARQPSERQVRVRELATTTGQVATASREVRQAIPGPPRIGGGAGNVLLIAGIAFIGYLFVTGRLKGASAAIFGPSPFLAPAAKPPPATEMVPGQPGEHGKVKINTGEGADIFHASPSGGMPEWKIVPRGTPGINPAAPDPYTSNPENIPPRWGRYRQ